jgi:hypothetical protein
MSPWAGADLCARVFGSRNGPQRGTCDNPFCRFTEDSAPRTGSLGHVGRKLGPQAREHKRKQIVAVDQPDGRLARFAELPQQVESLIQAGDGLLVSDALRERCGGCQGRHGVRRIAHHLGIAV